MIGFKLSEYLPDILKSYHRTSSAILDIICLKIIKGKKKEVGIYFQFTYKVFQVPVMN